MNLVLNLISRTILRYVLNTSASVAILFGLISNSDYLLVILKMDGRIDGLNLSGKKTKV